MPNTVMKTALYILAFFPLWLLMVAKEVILFLTASEECFPTWTTILYSIWLALSIISITLLILFKCSKANAIHKTFANIRKYGTPSIDYLVAYLVPLLVFDTTKLAYCVVFAMLFLLMGILHVKYNLTKYNLFLDLVGYTSCIAESNGEEVFIYVKKYGGIKDKTKSIVVKNLDVDVYISS